MIPLAAAETETVELNEGWNIISSPFGGTSLNIENIEAQCNLANYDGELSWMYGGNWEHPQTIKPQEGVLLYSLGYCSAEVDSESGEDVDITEPKQLKSGWNMISVPKEMEVNDISSDCTFLYRGGKSVWEYKSGEWETNNLSHELKPKKGYYVSVTRDCEMYFNTVAKPPTPK
jgi:hypothetical protein